MMLLIERISVIGAGAMGATFACKFFEMDKNCISLVARGERYDLLKDKGLIVNNKHYSLPVIRPEHKPPHADLIIVAVKHHHLQDAIQGIEGLIGDNTLVLSVMNGIDSEERIGNAYGMGRVLYTVVIDIDAVKEGNRIIYTRPGKVFFGEAENHKISERVKGVQSLFDRAGIAYETPDDMIRILWWKFMINAGINQVSAILGAPYGVFQTVQEAREVMESAMREVMAIAGAAKVHLYEADLENWYSVLSGLSPQGKTSMLQDVEAKRKTEVEMFAGKVIELGKAYNIPTPINETIFRLISVIERY